MKKKKKIANKKKFISRIVEILLIILVLNLFINGIRKKDIPKIIEPRLILDGQNITDSLSQDVYIDIDGILYMSIADIRNFLDKDIYYEEDTEKIITTYGTKVAAIDINSNIIEINSASLILNYAIMKYYDTIYIPVSELTSIYNVEIKTSGNSAVILSLYKELITVNTKKDVPLRENESSFATVLEELKEGQELVFIENSEKSGWIKVISYKANIGYVKDSDVTNRTEVRKNMEDSDFTSNEPDINNSIELNSKTITQETLKDFSSRKKIVEDTISKVISKEKYTVNLNLDKVEVSEEKLERFVIELIPRLKEIGVSVAITNKN